MFLDRARALKRGHSGTLRIGATPQTITALLAPFLPRYRRHYPDVEVQLIEGSASRQRSRLERGEIHLAIMPAGDGRLLRRPLFPVHALVVLPKAHRLARHAVVEVRELASERLLLLQREYASRAWFDAACEMALVRPLAVMESTTAYTLIELTEVDFGVAVVPSTSTIQSPQLRAVPLVHRGVPIGQWSTICWDPLRLLAPFAEGFLKDLVVYARRAPPGRHFLRRAPPLPEPQDGDQHG